MSSWKVELDYAKQLVGAGLDGVAAARREYQGPVFGPSPAGAIWKPAAVGAGIGMVGGRLIGNRKTVSRLAVAGLVGSLAGSALALAWISRRFTRQATGKAVLSVNAVRDRRWLRANPIDYA